MEKNQKCWSLKQKNVAHLKKSYWIFRKPHHISPNQSCKCHSARSLRPGQRVHLHSGSCARWSPAFPAGNIHCPRHNGIVYQYIRRCPSLSRSQSTWGNFENLVLDTWTLPVSSVSLDFRNSGHSSKGKNHEITQSDYIPDSQLFQSTDENIASLSQLSQPCRKPAKSKPMPTRIEIMADVYWGVSELPKEPNLLLSRNTLRWPQTYRLVFRWKDVCFH